MMKLEINTRGAWRTVLEFDEQDLSRVLDAVDSFSAAFPSAKWSLRDNSGQRRWIKTHRTIGDEGLSPAPDEAAE